MEAKFLLNGNEIAYLTHGQPFLLDIDATGPWFLVINYDKGGSWFEQWTFRKPRTVYESVTNVHKPHIRVWGVGRGVSKLLHRKLNINYVNVLWQKLRVLPMDGVIPAGTKIDSTTMSIPGLRWRIIPMCVGLNGNNIMHISVKARITSDLRMRLVGQDDHATFKSNCKLSSNNTFFTI
jgi:hypothetical protein